MDIKKTFKDFVNEANLNEGKFDGIADLVKALHFETDSKTAEEMKMAIGKSQGEFNKKKQIEGGEYSLRRFRKEIKFGDGTYLGVFLPGSYDAATSVLGDGPHKKAVKKVKWNQKKYDQWLEDSASNGGADNAFDMAQNAKNEIGLIDWVKKEFRGDDPLQRIQWDIEGYAESVTTEGKYYGMIAGDAASDIAKELSFYVKKIIKQSNGKVTYFHVKDQPSVNKTMYSLRDLYGIESQSGDRKFSPYKTVKFDNDQIISETVTENRELIKIDSYLNTKDERVLIDFCDDAYGNSDDRKTKKEWNDARNDLSYNELVDYAVAHAENFGMDLQDIEDAIEVYESVVTEEVTYNSSNTKPEAAKKATKEFGKLLPKANKGVEPYVFAVVKTKARNYRLAIKSGSYVAHEFMSGLKEDGILTADIVKKAVANVIKLNPEEFNESVVNEASEDRIIKQIERALKDGTSIFKLPMATQNYYNKNKGDFEVVTEARPGTKTYYHDRDVLPPHYGNSELHDKSEEMFKKSWKKLNDKQKDEVLSSFPKNESVVTESKNSKEIKELEKLLKSIKSNTPAEQGRKASIQDDIERLKNEVVTEAKNTIGLAFKEEQDYLDFKEFVAEQPRGAIRKNIGFDSKTKSWNVEMDVKVLDSIYGEGTPSDKKSGWYGGLPDDFESVIIEGAISKSRFETFLNEASRRKVHKAAKQGSYPAVIVVVQDGKVIHQEPVSTPDIAPATFNVMQEKYPKALLHLEDKTGKRLFSESIVNEARQAPAKTLFKMIVKGSASEIEGVKISSAMAQAALDWFDRSTYARKYEKQVKTAGMGAVAPLIFGDNWGIKKTIPSKLKAEFKELQAKYKRVMPENESAITEAKFDKKKLMKAMKQDDGMIQLGNGQEYVIYAYDNGNDDNDAMWGDKSIFALDQDGEEHEVKYSDIVSYNESVVTEGMSKSAVKKAIKVIDKQIDTETGGDGEALNNETLQALEQERERLLSMNEAKAYKLKASEFGGDTHSAAYNVKGETTWRVHSTYAIDQVSGENNPEERDVIFFEAMPINNDIYIKIGGINNLKRSNGSTVGENFGTTIEEWKKDPKGIAKEASEFLTDATHLKWINKKARSEGQVIKWALKDDYASVIEDLVNKSLGLNEAKTSKEKLEYLLWDLENSNKLSNPSDPKKKAALIKKLKKQLDTVKESLVVESTVNEAKGVNRAELTDYLEKHLKLVRTSEEFDGTEGGVWTSAENGEKFSGSQIFDYYSESSKYEFGVLNKFAKVLSKMGWYCEFYDPGTVMIWEE